MATFEIHLKLYLVKTFTHQCTECFAGPKDNVSQCKIANNLGLSPSTVHNIVKRPRESGEISVCKGQGRKPLWNAREHRALRQYCLRNRHSTTWARENFRKIVTQPQSAAASGKCNLKFYYAKRKTFLCRNAAEFSGPQVIWDWPKRVEICQNSFWEKRISDSTCQRWKRPSRLLPTKSAKNSLCDGMGCIRAYGMGDLHISKGTIDAEAYVGDICCCQDDFSQELHVYLNRTMPGLVLHELQPRGLVGIECVCLTRLPAVQICLLLKVYGAWWRGCAIHFQIPPTTDCWAAQVLSTPRTCKHSTCKTATIDIFSSQTITKLKEKVMLPKWWIYLCPNFFGVCCRHQFLNLYISNK